MALVVAGYVEGRFGVGGRPDRRRVHASVAVVCPQPSTSVIISRVYKALQITLESIICRMVQYVHVLHCSLDLGHRRHVLSNVAADFDDIVSELLSEGLSCALAIS